MLNKIVNSLKSTDYNDKYMINQHVLIVNIVVFAVILRTRMNNNKIFYNWLIQRNCLSQWFFSNIVGNK